jgi:hypothetical protein
MAYDEVVADQFDAKRKALTDEIIAVGASAD